MNELGNAAIICIMQAALLKLRIKSCASNIESNMPIKLPDDSASIDDSALIASML